MAALSRNHGLDQTVGLDVPGPLAGGQPSLLLLSSGTAGPAQVIDLPMTAALHAAWAVRNVVDRNPRLLACLPTGHVSHQLVNVLAATLLGGEVCFGDGEGVAMHPRDLVADLRRSRPTVLFGSPALFAEVAEELTTSLQGSGLGRAILRRLEIRARGSLERGLIERGRQTVTGSLIGWRLRRTLGLQATRDLFSGTAPLDPSVHAELGAVGWFVRNTYGLSECGGAASISASDRMVPGELGQVVEGMEIRIGSDGQVLLRGPSMMRGYLGLPGMEPGDWLATGDVALRGERGAVFFHDRLRNVLRTPDGPVTLRDIEQAVSGLFPPATAVAVARDDRSADLFVFVGNEEAAHLSVAVVERAMRDSRLWQMRCVRRVAVVPGYPSAGRYEIGTTGEVRRWMVRDNWGDFLEERDRRVLVASQVA
jgi:long-chain acyl-CoA synthetase